MLVSFRPHLWKMLFCICGNTFIICWICGDIFNKYVQVGSNSGSQVPRIFIFLLISCGHNFAISKSVVTLPLTWTELVLLVFPFQFFSAPFSLSLTSFGSLFYFWFCLTFIIQSAIFPFNLFFFPHFDSLIFTYALFFATLFHVSISSFFLFFVGFLVGFFVVVLLFVCFSSPV